MGKILKKKKKRQREKEDKSPFVYKTKKFFLLGLVVRYLAILSLSYSHVPDVNCRSKIKF